MTDAKGPLDGKELYDPATTSERVAEHAVHFCDLLEETAAATPAARVVVAMFDFELFGHWWFEGIDFLAAVFRELARRGGPVRPATAWEAVSEAGDEAEAIALPAGSWGRDGDFSVWDNPETKDYWRRGGAMPRSAARAIAARDPRLRPGGDPAAPPPRGVRLALPRRERLGARLRREADRRSTPRPSRRLRPSSTRPGPRTREDALLLARLARRDRAFGPELGG